MKIYVKYDNENMSICELPVPMQSAPFEIEEVTEQTIVISYDLEKPLDHTSENILNINPLVISYWYRYNHDEGTLLRITNQESGFWWECDLWSLENWASEERVFFVRSQSSVNVLKYLVKQGAIEEYGDPDECWRDMRDLEEHDGKWYYKKYNDNAIPVSIEDCDVNGIVYELEDEDGNEITIVAPEGWN